MHDIADFNRGLKELLEAQAGIVAAWEGGSVATGFADEYSDLDLLIVVGDENTEPVFTLLQEYFEGKYGIERSFRLPEPTWHGMSQCFYLLRGFPPCFYCDIAVVPAQNPNKFTEPDRHGNALIWFDKAGIYQAEPTTDEDRDKLLARMYRSATAVDWLGRVELEKALLRENWLASQMNFIMFMSRHLVPLLNIKYRPYKADFGIRYAERDYPEEIAELLEDLLRLKSVEDVRANTQIAIKWFQGLKSELEHIYGEKP